MKWRKRIGERKLLGEESWSCDGDTRGDVTTSLFETLGFGKLFLKKVWKEGLHKARVTFWWFLATKKNMLVPTLSWHCPDSLKTTCCFAHLGFLAPKKKIGSNPFLNIDQILWKQLVVLLMWNVDYETFKILCNISYPLGKYEDGRMLNTPYKLGDAALLMCRRCNPSPQQEIQTLQNVKWKLIYSYAGEPC